MTAGHTVKRFPPSRQFTMDVGRIGIRKHHIRVLVEFDSGCAAYFSECC
ncbi:MAG: hypothetical protein ACOC2H_07505 [Spirochaetota bacterium]